MAFDPVKELSELKDGAECIWPESDYGRAEIWKKNGHYFIWEIPMYGGIPRYSFASSSVDDVVRIVGSWT